MKSINIAGLIKKLSKPYYAAAAGLFLLIVLAALLFIVGRGSGHFTNLETRQGEGYSLLVPAGWQQSADETQAIYYGGESLKTSDDAVIVGYSAQAVPGYADYSQEEKQELLAILENLLNTYVSGESADTSASYDEVSTTPGSHPQAELALDAALSGQNAEGTSYKSEGKLLVTEDGRFYFILAGSQSGTFAAESESIEDIINSFTLTSI